MDNNILCELFLINLFPCILHLSNFSWSDFPFAGDNILNIFDFAYSESNNALT